MASPSCEEAGGRNLDRLHGDEDCLLVLTKEELPPDPPLQQRVNPVLERSGGPDRGDALLECLVRHRAVT